MMELPAYLHIAKVGAVLNDIIGETEAAKLAILCDSRTAKECLPPLREGCGLSDYLLIEIPEGEEAKSLTSCQLIWEQLTDSGFSRHDLLINLGGGMVTDLGGFCAASFKRGMPFIQIPTSLLAMVDASIGGKTGVNFNRVKNHIGAFADPLAVIIDEEFLKTLDDRQWWNGYAEVVKHAALQGESQLEKCLAINDRSDMEDLIPQSLAYKWSVVEEDPFEKGPRKVLNLGHTLGHAIESSSAGSLLHGESILLGMEMEFFLSEEIFDFDSKWRSDLKKFRENHYPKLHELRAERLLSFLSQDKKNRGATIRASLLEKPGKAKFDVVLTENHIADLFKAYGID